MKQIIILFAMLTFCNAQTRAQGDILFGVGLVYGSNLYNSLTITKKQDADTQIDSRSRSRYGLSFIYSPADLFYLKSGVEIAKREYSINSPQSLNPINYKLTYLHIPFTASFELFFSEDLFGDGGTFLAPECGLGIDILNVETTDGQSTDTGFTKVNLIAKAGTNIGLRQERFRVYLNSTLQYTLNPAVSNNFLNTTRALYFSAQFHVEYYL